MSKRIPFNVKFRPQIESGEYKVETREGLPARIICWDRKAKKHDDNDLNLCVLIPKDEGEGVYYYHRSGKKWVPDDDYDLFLITPEPEKTEFENGMLRYLQDAANKKDDSEIIESTKEHSPKLLTLAKQQLLQSGELLSQEHHEKLMETLNKAHEEELEKAYKNADEVQYRKGREDALKDLPRWEFYRRGTEIDPFAVVRFKDGTIGRAKCAVDDCYVLEVKDMLKLPGFNDEHHE